MPRFYFNVFNDEVTLDDEGADLADLAAARKRAVVEARLFAAESIVARGHLVLTHHIEIASDEGALETVTFGDAIEIQGREP
jgi:hypothetical protein